MRFHLAWRALTLSAALAQMGCPGMGEVLRLYGYTEVRPPSKFYAPGSLMWVKHRRPLEGGIICPASASLGVKFQPRVSPTAAMELKRATERDLFLDGAYLMLLRADARFRMVQNVRVKLENPVIFELADTDVIKHQRARSAECRHAIAMRKNAGYQITMVAAALRADVTYTVEWSHSLGGGVGNNIEALDALALELGAENAVVTERTIEAKGLYWGIKDDAFLAQLGEGRQMLELVDHRRVIGPAALFISSAAPDVAETLAVDDDDNADAAEMDVLN